MKRGKSKTKRIRPNLSRTERVEKRVFRLRQLKKEVLLAATYMYALVEQIS